MLQPSVNTRRLPFGAPAGDTSWETIVRPVVRSVNRIGSIVIRFVQAKLLSSQVALAGIVESLKVTRRVCLRAMNIALPVFQLTPIEGSPEALPKPPVAAKL